MADMQTDSRARSRERLRKRIEHRNRVNPRVKTKSVDHYGLLLLLLFTEIMLLISISASSIMFIVDVAILCGTMILALRTSEARIRTLRVGYVGSAVALALTFALAWGPGTILGLRSVGYIYAIMAFLAVATLPAILSRLLRHTRVNIMTLLGALCAYLLIGMSFAYVYLAMNALVSAPFLAQGANEDPAIYVYLSYVTLTTVGFGDYTAGTNFGRALIVLEALLGQIFLVTTVARVVSLYKPAEMDDAGSSDTPSGAALPLGGVMKRASEEAGPTTSTASDTGSSTPGEVAPADA